MKHPRLRRWLRISLWTVGVLTSLLAGFVVWVYLTCFAEPPPLTARPPILDQVPASSPDGRVHLGRSWFRRDPGCSLLYLEGDPFTLGYSNSTLTQELLEVQERSLIDTARAFFPSRLSFLAVGLLVLINNRSLPSFVPIEYQYEILGLSSGGKDPFPEYGPRYHRILNYHAAHDISHWVLDKPVLGCTAFAARGRQTRDGHLLVGRNFDFEGGRHFDENKIIGLYRPEKGHAFLSVSWPGMAGAVTGMNEVRMFCSINGAHSEDRGRIGKPVSLVVREVLQYAGSVDEAVAIVRAVPVFVSDSFLIADGKTNEAVVVEKSPGKAGVRGMEDDLLFQANHFECPGFAADAGNAAYEREGTSLSRRTRLRELVEAHRGQLDPPATVEILRDRRGPGGKNLALGHRGAINPMIATHSVVADLTARVLWVSRGPHQLGRFEAFGFEAFGEPGAPPVPEDPALASGDYQRLCRARALVEQAKEELAARRRLGADALRRLEEAMALNPRDPAAHWMYARALEAEGRREEALEQLKTALDGEPPFLADRQLIEGAIRNLEPE